jgi:AraC-like DNA-binding protein
LIHIKKMRGNAGRRRSNDYRIAPRDQPCSGLCNGDDPAIGLDAIAPPASRGAVTHAHALSNVTDHPKVTDLCRVTGVSERAVQNAFMEVMGLTPAACLVRVRLHRARRALLAATQGSTTVSVEALNSGFWHFGEFSRAYKDCFGELPSDTLRRKPGEQQRQGHRLCLPCVC